MDDGARSLDVVACGRAVVCAALAEPERDTEIDRFTVLYFTYVRPTSFVPVPGAALPEPATLSLIQS